MNTSGVLDRAADLIEEKGWGTGPSTWLANSPRGLCLEGAILAAMEVKNSFHSPQTGIANTCPAGLAVREYLGLGQYTGARRPDASGRGLWAWNDNLQPLGEDLDPDWKETGRQRVIETLRAAALIERAKENTDTEVREAAHV